MKKIKYNKKIMKYAMIVILLIILSIISIIYRSNKKNFSKYSNYYDVQSISQISKPIFQVDGNESIKIDGQNDKIYNFSVKNYDSDNISDTSLDYYIKFVNNSEADLQFILTKDGEKIELINNETTKITLPSLSKKEDNYKLLIKYNEKSDQLEDLNGNVQIKVEAIQTEV